MKAWRKVLDITDILKYGDSKDLSDKFEEATRWFAEKLKNMGGEYSKMTQELQK